MRVSVKSKQFVASSAHLDYMITGPLNLNAKLNQKDAVLLLSSFPSIVSEFIHYFPQYEELFKTAQNKLQNMFDFMDNTLKNIIEEVKKGIFIAEIIG